MVNYLYENVIFFGIFLLSSKDQQPLVLSTSCASAELSETYMTYDNAVLLSRCPSSGVGEPREHAFRAIQASLADVDWVLADVRAADLVVDARKCVPSNLYSPDYLKRVDGNCATVRFIVQKNADIHAVIPKERPAPRTVFRNLREWMFSLERNYAELRCYNDDVLNERVANQKGIKK